jgi:hypothetical protein
MLRRDWSSDVCSSDLVVDSETREPVAGVAVAVSRPGVIEPMILKAAPGGGRGVSGAGAPGWEERARTDADGRYRFTRVDPGDYTVSIQGGGVAPARRDGVAVGDGRSPVTVDFATTRAAAIEVRVESIGPEMPAVLAAIETESDPETAHHPWRPMKPVVFRDLAPGAYRIYVRDLLDTLAAVGRVEVRAGETATITLVLEKKERERAAR